MAYLFMSLLVVSLLGVFITRNRRPVVVDYLPDLLGMPMDRGEMSPSMRLHHLWMRKLAICDEKMAIFEEACSIYGVDPEVDSKEREYIEELYLYDSSSVTPGITQIRIDEYRMERSQNA